MSKVKGNVFQTLKDVAYFHDSFKEETMNCDVLPWLMEKAGFFVQQLDAFDNYPNSFVNVLALDTQLTHKQKTEEYRTMIETRRRNEELAEQQRLADKERRRANREAKRKAEERERLRQNVFENFVSVGKPEFGILTLDLVDIDGNQSDKP